MNCALSPIDNFQIKIISYESGKCAGSQFTDVINNKKMCIRLLKNKKKKNDFTTIWNNYEYTVTVIRGVKQQR